MDENEVDLKWVAFLKRQLENPKANVGIEMENINALGIEYRLVKDAHYHGQPVRVVSGSRTYATTIEELWDAVTNAKRIPLWFAPITGALKLGGRFQLKDNAGGDITRCDRPTALDFTWECGSVSWVTVRLESVDGGTRLTLEHLIAKDEASEAHWKKYGPAATGVGWDFGFLGLGRYLDSGEAVCESEFMASPDGKIFIKDCAKSWSDAHIRCGEVADTATAMADETAAFYCGN